MTAMPTTIAVTARAVRRDMAGIFIQEPRGVGTGDRLM